MTNSVRDLADAKAKRDLLHAYISECERVEQYAAVNQHFPETGEFAITYEERLGVFERRRDRLYNDLVNKGIKLHTEASDTLPSIAKAHAELAS